MNVYTFTICAYKDSPYLESCIKSLKKQTVSGTIILCTSTPSSYIQGMMDEHGIPVFTRDGQSDIQTGWSLIYHMADFGLVTIAYQDDMHHRQYVITVQNCWKRYPDTSVMTTDAVIVKHGQLQELSQAEFVKKMLRLPLRAPTLNHLTVVRRSALRFGNPIMCLSCTYNKGILGEPLFQSDCKFVLDWNTMTQLAERNGRFIYIEKPSLCYRIHEKATTRSRTKDHRREQGEADMYRKFWPDFLVRLLMKGYCRAYDSYDEA